MGARNFFLFSCFSNAWLLLIVTYSPTNPDRIHYRSRASSTGPCQLSVVRFHRQTGRSQPAFRTQSQDPLNGALSSRPSARSRLATACRASCGEYSQHSHWTRRVELEVWSCNSDRLDALEDWLY